MKRSPIKKLLLAGAGHAHIGMLRQISDASLDTSDIDICLVSEQTQTIYSGMLPGWMAGHYQLDDISIDTKSLCARAGVRFIQQAITQVYAASNTVVTDGNDMSTGDETLADDKALALDYDVLSLNTGADTDIRWLESSAGVIAIRPLSAFITHWQQILADAKQSDNYQLAIVGAGAAATELVMAAQVALQHINNNHQVTLVCGKQLLSGFNTRFQERVIRQLHRHGIKIVYERAIDYRNGHLSTTDDSLPMNAVIAATGVVGAAWTTNTDLQTVDKGFVAVNNLQQSISHPNVFAVGDVATRVDKEVAHSGVHAVHGGAVEGDNLFAYLKGESMQEYQPKARTLYLLSCGDKYAIASWGDWSLQGRGLWYLKRYIDKRFVKSYS
ncbi:FAD-dependent oxidoreductase [Psychrobacter sp. T6-6]|uniref:FAD-dependent oxidoreductase n=1 Tax=Psychrobacter sp. T6-6 TaxID=3457452 RepID=UPI003FD5E650